MIHELPELFELFLSMTSSIKETHCTPHIPLLFLSQQKHLMFQQIDKGHFATKRQNIKGNQTRPLSSIILTW